MLNLYGLYLCDGTRVKTLTTKEVFIKENYNAMIDSLIGQIVDLLCC